MIDIYPLITRIHRTLLNTSHPLEGVIKQHDGSLLAFLSSHDGRKRRSLAVAIGRDGQIVMKRFASCDNHDIAITIGLNITDLFPHTNNKYQPQTRSYINEWQTLSALQFDAIVFLIAVCKILAGEALLEADIAYLSQAIKIDKAVNLLNEWVEEDVFSWSGLIGLPDWGAK